MAAQGEECNGNEWIRAAKEKLGVTRPRKGIALIGIERMGNAKEQLSAETIGRATPRKSKTKKFDE